MKMAKKDDHKAEIHTETQVTIENEVTQTISGDQVAELTGDLQRLQADFMNYKRRSEEEKGELLTFTISRVMRELLPVRDNFDRELANRPEGLNPVWAASIDSIRAQFDSSLKGLRVERFDSVGQDFDPHLHEAVASEGSGEVVIEELQAGYKLGDAVIRPAMVKVGDK
jgi:molecular chaperone GrpE